MVLIRYRLCTDIPLRTVGFALLARFVILLAFSRSCGWGRATAERCRDAGPQRTAHGVRLRLTVCFDQSVKLGPVLSDVLLLFPVKGLCLATLGFEVSQRQWGCVLWFKNEQESLNSWWERPRVLT